MCIPMRKSDIPVHVHAYNRSLVDLHPTTRQHRILGWFFLAKGDRRALAMNANEGGHEAMREG